MDDSTLKHAVFSSCRRYRYSLWRMWDVSKPFVLFIGLNPSTADEINDDPTIRRCIAYARDWGFGGLCMVNIFAFRATDPAKMKAEPNPVGEDNDNYLIKISAKAGIIVAAWGTHGSFKSREDEVRELIFPLPLHCLGITKNGHPKHPLYLPRGLKPQIWIKERSNG